MELNVFGRKMVTKDGKKSFYNYFSKIIKGGKEMSVTVKFREECGNPTKVPCVIKFDKYDANLSTKEKTYEVTEDGITETKTTTENVIWITNYTEHEYVDTSLDDVETV